MVELRASAAHGCYSCGRSMLKAKKVYRTKRYCETCYARLFKPRLCPGCGERKRLATFDAFAVCSSCVTAAPCVRCKRTGRPVGKLTMYGPACNSCAHYYTEPRPCDACGTLSTRLTKKHADGQDLKCCPKCASACETCPRCRRSRVLVENASGERQCKLCTNVGDVSCRTCDKPSPAGRGPECEDCYHRRTFYKRLQLNVEALASDTFRAEYQAYGEWLIQRVGGKRASFLINPHLETFVEMNLRWDEIPSYAQMLESLGAAWLRRARLPMIWMSDTRGVLVDEAIKAEDTELRRIDTIIDSVAADSLRDVLMKYRAHLESNPGKRQNSPRSIRMAMRSAANLLLVVSSSDVALPSTASLNSLLAQTPGIAASLAGFVNFLNGRYQLGIQFPKDNSLALKARRQRAEQQIKHLVREAETGADVLDRWPAAALEYFHGVSRYKRSELTLTEDSDHQGLTISLQGRIYWIPLPSPVEQG